MIKHIVRNAEDAFLVACGQVLSPAEKCISLGDRQEIVGVLILNRHNEVVGADIVGAGSDTECIMPVKLIAKLAVDRLATGVVLLHTHPSCHVEPGPEDIGQTKKVRDALKLLDIELMDHLIIASDKSRYHSFADEKTSDAPKMGLRRKTGGAYDE